jgi:hypothetical protein
MQRVVKTQDYGWLLDQNWQTYSDYYNQYGTFPESAIISNGYVTYETVAIRIPDFIHF